jgi:hypothetical protein
MVPVAEPEFSPRIRPVELNGTVPGWRKFTFTYHSVLGFTVAEAEMGASKQRPLPSSTTSGNSKETCPPLVAAVPVPAKAELEESAAEATSMNAMANEVERRRVIRFDSFCSTEYYLNLHAHSGHVHGSAVRGRFGVILEASRWRAVAGEAPQHAGRLAAAPFQNVSSSERVVAEQVHVRRVAARVDAVVERADSSERRNFGLRMI